MSSVIALTEERLMELIEEVIFENNHCKKHPTKRRMECERADSASRRKSQRKRDYKEMVWPGYYDRNGSIDQVQRGLMETSSDTTLKSKLKTFISTLTPEEKSTFRRLLTKPSQQELMNYCSKWADASAGRMTIDPEKAIDLQLKAKKSQA